jgi:hypothetical protein
MVRLYNFDFISKIYLNIFIEVKKSDQDLITSDKYQDIQQLKEKVNRILTIISRDHMKVVFFGRLIDENYEFLFLKF